MVRPQRSRSAARWQVGDDPPGIAVRLQIQARLQSARHPLHQPGRHGVVERQRGERPGHRRIGLGLVADVQADQGVEWRAGGGRGERGTEVVAAGRGGRLRSDVGGNAGGGVAGAGERVAQARDASGRQQSGIGHDFILPVRPSGVASWPGFTTMRYAGSASDRSQQRSSSARRSPRRPCWRPSGPGATATGMARSHRGRSRSGR